MEGDGWMRTIKGLSQMTKWSAKREEAKKESTWWNIQVKLDLS